MRYGAFCMVAISPQPSSIDQHLQISLLQAGVLGDAGQHVWPNFLSVVEGKHEIRPAIAPKRAMRTGLSFDLPANTKQRGQNPPCLG